MKRIIKNWRTDYVDGHLVVRGELWSGDKKLFDRFCTHNPTEINSDEAGCSVSTGNQYILMNKLSLQDEPN
jgi:hypothetical protein